MVSADSYLVLIAPRRSVACPVIKIGGCSGYIGKGPEVDEFPRCGIYSVRTNDIQHTIAANRISNELTRVIRVTTGSEWIIERDQSTVRTSKVGKITLPFCRIRHRE